MATIKKDIGAYSAYAIAVKHGYKGTEAEWVAAQEKARVDSEAAAKAAKTAQEAAEAAREQAQTAKTSAETAQGAAAQAAQTATVAAGAATQAAKAAQTAKETAEQAQTGAQEARTGAEAANTKAQAAKTAAEEAAQEAKAAQTGAVEAQGKAEEAAQGVAADREQIGANKSSLEAAQQELTATKEQLAETKAALKKAQRAIQFQAELNKGQTWDFETDDSVAYSRTVPSGAHAGAVMSLSGKTRRGRNLLNLLTAERISDISSPSAGRTVSSNSVQLSTSADTTIKWDAMRFIIKGLLPGKYTMSLKTSSNNADIIPNMGIYLNSTEIYTTNVVGYSEYKFTISDGDVFKMYFHLSTDGVTPNGTVIKFEEIMLCSGTTVEPYEPYAPDLVSAQVDEVRVRGRNLLNPKWKSRITTNIFYGLETGGIPLKKGREYTLTVTNATNLKGLYFRSMDSAILVNTYTDTKLSYTPSEDIIVYVSCYCVPSVPDNTELMLTVEWQGSYAPYRETVPYPIPADVKALPGYGWSAGSVANTVERTENGWQYVQRVGSVDLGRLVWNVSTGNNGLNRFTCKLNGVAPPNSSAVAANAVCSAYDNIPAVKTYEGTTGISVEGGKQLLFVYDDRYIDKAAFTAAMTGIPLYYELATPITTDITALMGDFLAPFAVEAGGSITLHHPKADEGFAIDVPAKIQYITKLSEVSANG